MGGQEEIDPSSYPKSNVIKNKPTIYVSSGWGSHTSVHEVGASILDGIIMVLSRKGQWDDLVHHGHVHDLLV
jgi:hypothetical protein